MWKGERSSQLCQWWHEAMNEQPQKLWGVTLPSSGLEGNQLRDTWDWERLCHHGATAPAVLGDMGLF